jgi:hypothetical protein
MSHVDIENYVKAILLDIEKIRAFDVPNQKVYWIRIPFPLISKDRTQILRRVKKRGCVDMSWQNNSEATIFLA